MALYRSNLLDSNIAVPQALAIDCEGHDHAIDRARDLDHAHEIMISWGDRGVVRLPPCPARRLSF